MQSRLNILSVESTITKSSVYVISNGSCSRMLMLSADERGHNAVVSLILSTLATLWQVPRTAVCLDIEFTG